MVEVPRPRSQHELAERFPLVTDSATVTCHEPMDRSRNRDVLAALQDLLGAVGESA